MNRIPITKLDGCVDWEKPKQLGKELFKRKDTGYAWSTITVRVMGDDIQFVFSGYKVKFKYLTIHDRWRFTALDIINKFPDLGRHFEDTVLYTFKSLGLPLGYTNSILKDM